MERRGNDAYGNMRPTPRINLGAGLAISALVFGASGALLAAVLRGVWVVQWDAVAEAWIQARVTKTGLQLFEAVSLLGSPGAWGIAGITTVVLVRLHDYKLAGLWLVAFGGGKLLQAGLKMAVQRVRPIYGTIFLHGHSYGFPSGHAMGSLLCYGMLAYTLMVLWKPVRHRLGFLWLGTALVVGFVSVSRIYLGVHFPSDVAGGLLIGTGWLVLCITIAESLWPQPIAREPQIDRRGGA